MVPRLCSTKAEGLRAICDLVSKTEDCQDHYKGYFHCVNPCSEVYIFCYDACHQANKATIGHFRILPVVEEIDTVLPSDLRVVVAIFHDIVSVSKTQMEKRIEEGRRKGIKRTLDLVEQYTGDESKVAA